MFLSHLSFTIILLTLVFKWGVWDTKSLITWSGFHGDKVWLGVECQPPDSHSCPESNLLVSPKTVCTIWSSCQFLESRVCFPGNFCIRRVSRLFLFSSWEAEGNHTPPSGIPSLFCPQYMSCISMRSWGHDWAFVEVLISNPEHSLTRSQTAQNLLRPLNSGPCHQRVPWHFWRPGLVTVC